MVRSVIAAVVAGGMLLAPSTVRGQEDDPESSDDREARALFDAGQLAFAQGRFEVALTRFREGYELSDRPRFLFNIGVVADRLRRDAEALEAFEHYLRREPHAFNREEVEARIEVLRASVRAAREPSGGAPSAPRERSSGSGPAPWIVMGTGAAVAVGGAVLLGLALAERSDLQGLTVDDDVRYADVRDREDRVASWSTVGIVGLGLGGAGLVAGLVWALAGGGDTVVEAGPAAVRLRGTF